MARIHCPTCVRTFAFPGDCRHYQPRCDVCGTVTVRSLTSALRFNQAFDQHEAADALLADCPGITWTWEGNTVTLRGPIAHVEHAKAILLAD